MNSEIEMLRAELAEVRRELAAFQATNEALLAREMWNTARAAAAVAIIEQVVTTLGVTKEDVALAIDEGTRQRLHDRLMEIGETTPEEAAFLARILVQRKIIGDEFKIAVVTPAP